MSSITPFYRPPTGVYPACPPPPMVDCFSSLERCYDDVKRAQAFLKQMLIDIINCDPSIIGRGTPIIGVTDGTDAQPGMVGEWVSFTGATTYTGTGSMEINTVSLGALSAGDWNCEILCWPTTAVDFAYMNLNPAPSGMMGYSDTGLSTPISEGLGRVVGPTFRILSGVPSLIAVETRIIDTSPGTANVGFYARRMR